MIFHIEKQTDGARTGSLTTRSGVLHTPFFMPDATRASVRGVTTDEVKESGIEALVVNTYHLFLQPGEDLIKKSGGIHRFMHWDGPILSDSGGYQVYSLIHQNPEMGRITEEGAEFKSIFDGSKHLLTPERAIQIQFDLGVDMMVCLDDPRPNDASEEEVKLAVERTLRWADRCKIEFEKQTRERGMTDENRPLLFSVVQGGLFVSLRKKCAEGLVEIGFDGYGFGGRHIDEDGNFLAEILAKTAEYIPEESIRFALGIGTPSDIVRCHALGWDMFDCVIPTREGRHGRLFVYKNSSMAGNWKLVTGNIPEITADEQTASITNYQLPITSSDFYQTINIVNEQFE
ncbi:MAG: tRNA guanosine(34) transglycosylase Tgt, partial [Candidatus Moraniibacteriota bacterium]